MHMVRHHDGDLQVEPRPVVVQTRVENNRTNAFRENPPVLSAKSYKVRFVIDLKMRQLSPIKSLRHGKNRVGTAALGCPAERSSARF
jgi:hypothetical protein